MKLFLIHILSFLLLSFTVSAKTHHVGKQHGNITIQQAIDMSENGDTVLVDSGHYREKNIIVNKAIVLKGINKPVLDGENKYEIISVKSDNATIDGFKVIHSGTGVMEDPAGIKIYESRHVSILNNELYDTFFGIYTQRSAQCIIKNNTLTAIAIAEEKIGNGIHCWKSDSLQIIANHINGHRDGIYFEFVTNSIIWRNISTNNKRYGLHFMFSNNDTYITNTFRNNGAGVAVMYTHGVKMFNNLFEENWGDAAYGLLLKEISDSHIEGNIFTKNTSGIYMEGTSRLQVERNLFKDNGWAIKIQASCMDVNVTKNNFLGNTFDVGTNGSLVLNNFDGNYWDKYEGYDLNKDKIGDIPYRPVSLFSMILEKIPPAMMLFRSFMVTLLDKTEKIIPSITPENLKDNSPLMKAYKS
ncbi:MAG: nitrous oxide reductase family maturation protein NosD [Bacteroidota bacterium]